MNTPLTPLDFLERARRLYGSLEAVVDGDRRINYAEYAARCHRLAHALRRELHLQPGERVAYLCGNTLELLEAYYGVVLAGGVLTPLNIRLGPAELQEIVDDCSPKVLFEHPHVANPLDVPARISIGSEYEALLAAQPSELFDAGSIDEDAVCELFYTSGTTDRPKGAMLTHRALATHAIDSALTLGLVHRDVILHTIPLFHVNGWGTPHYVTALGARHVMIERFDAAEVLRLIDAEGVTMLSIVPTMGASLLAADRGGFDGRSLRLVTVGGAPPAPTMLAELEAAFGCEVICGYGLTETSPQLTKAMTRRDHDALPVAEQRRRRATTGVPNVGVDLRVLDYDGLEVAANGTAIGEICVRSNHTMAGYWNQPDETDAAFAGGWLHTGDMAVVDTEGYVTIVDRRKDVIISGGENISSVHVEHTLMAHPSVLEAAVVGMPDPKWGEVPRAFVTLRPDAPAVAEAELIDWVRTRLAHFKAPKRVDVLSVMPTGGTGKIQKGVLRTWE